MTKHMERIALLVVLALVSLVLPSWLSAQRMEVRGRVIDVDGKPLAGGDILLLNKDNGQKFSMKTDKKGEFVNIGVALGNYHLTLSKDGKVIYQDNMVVNGTQQFQEIDLHKASTQQPTPEQQQQAIKQMTPEQRKQVEEQQKQYEEQQKAVEAERTKIQSLNQMLATADADEKAGNIDQAISTYKQATATDATQPVLWARLGGAYLTAGSKTAASDRPAAAEDYNQAAEAFKKAIALNGSVAGYHNNLGQAYAKLGKTDDAMAEYTTAAQLDPGNAGLYYYNLGAILTNSGKVDDANAAFDKAIAADPSRADAYYWKGVNLLAKATLKDNKMVAPPGTAENLNKYLELAPTGTHADSAKELLTSIGAKVETSYQKKK